MVSSNKSRFRSFTKKYFGVTGADKTFNIILYLFFALFAFSTLYPFLHVVSESLKVVVPTNTGVPVYRLSFQAYVQVLKEDELTWAFVWSIIVVLISTTTHVFCCMLSAYPLSKKHLRGRTGFLMFIVITMLFSGGLIPYYVLMDSLGFFSNPLIYVLPCLVSGFDVIIAKNFLQSIPQSLEEAAKLDGANDYEIFFKVYIPQSFPIMATLALWFAVGKWNDWSTGVFYMAEVPRLQLIQNYLRRILASSNTTTGGGAGNDKYMMMGDNLKMAIVVVGTLPIVLIYPFVQKYFVKGVMLGSVKE